MRKRKGFTLAELLIVVAIIGVLVAIAIPVFTSSLEKAREATCLANQTSAQHAIVYEKLMDTKVETNEAGLAIIESTVGDVTKLCPSGGTYRYNPENGIVSCNKHNASSVDLVNRDPDKILSLPKVMEFFFDAAGKRKPANRQLDSTGPNFGPETRLQIQSALGLPDDKFDFRVYWPPTDAEPKIYVFDKITLENKDEKRPVTGYLLHQNADGKWEIKKRVTGEGVVQEAQVEDKNHVMVKYAQMKVENIKW